MVTGNGYMDGFMDEVEARTILAESLGRQPLGDSILVIIPDGTRTALTPLFFRLLAELLLERVDKLDYLVALGTHALMSKKRLNSLVGIEARERTGRYADIGIYNHRWDLPETFVTVDTISAREIEELSGGLVAMDVPVTVNRMVLEYDTLLVCGPTYPHEVVGFSGGNKYFFPGISGPEVINVTHWIGALLTSSAVIGSGYTCVRAIIDRAAQSIPRRRLCASHVVREHRLAGLYVGTPEEAWERAARLSAQVHIHWVERPFRRALGVVPAIYDDLWTGAKGMFKLEPVIETGGEIVLFAPHIDEISYTHGKILDVIGYHGTEYFLDRWERFGHLPGAVLAHSTFVRGVCTYLGGVEKPRIRLTLAARVPRERCERLGLGYLDPDKVNVTDWQGKEDEGILFVPRAGERLFRLERDRVFLKYRRESN